MDQYMNTAYDVTTQLFGPESGIPWWAWVFVVLAVFFKVLVPQTSTGREATEERDAMMVDELLGDGGKKGKK
jgi:hypothetical protein